MDIIKIHSVLAYAVVVLVFLFFVLLLLHFITASKGNDLLKKVALISLIATHTQTLVGLIQYFIVSKRGFNIILSGNLDMGNASQRFYAIEHPLMMILGAIMFTVTYSNLKRSSGKVSFMVFVYGLIAVILLFSRIPHQWLPIKFG